eukprot:7385766-Prymnesium_polylepis.2
MLWASVIATLCAFVADANSMQTEFHRTVDELNQLMSRYAFPQQVCTRHRGCDRSRPAAAGWGMPGPHP